MLRCSRSLRHGCKKNALARAVDAMPEKFRIDAECTLDFTLNLVPAANP